MQVTAIKTHRISAGELLTPILDRYLPVLEDGWIVAIASKIVSLSENNYVAKTSGITKSELIKREAQYCFPAPPNHPNDFYLTLKQRRLLPNAGIDESNTAQNYLLLPADPQATARQIWHHLRQRNRIINLGVIITDSNLTPLRCGISGIGIGWCGLLPVYSYIGQTDLYGNPIRVTQVNLLDNLATAATLVMGEVQEQTPLAIIREPPSTVKFQDRAPTSQEEAMVAIDPHDDLFSSVINYG